MIEENAQVPVQRTYVGEFSLDLPLRRVQALRLVQALMESDYLLCLPAEDAHKFTHLKKVFDLHYAVGKSAVILPGVRLSHPEPTTRVGSIQRTLIFPRAVFDHCRRLWPSERPIRYLFTGLITKKRHQVLSHWLRRTLPNDAVELPGNENLGLRFRRKLGRLLGLTRLQLVQKLETGGLVCWASECGRHLPMKAWHDEYYAQMSKAQFVLCPDGDFVWTYRFFEAILCGAIPVVESRCPAYAGFRFQTMADDAQDLQWSESIALHNFNLAFERLTIPHETLNREIASLLEAAQNRRLHDTGQV